jgi:hypothetical protein
MTFTWQRGKPIRRSGGVLKSELLETADPVLADRNVRDIARIINSWFGGHMRRFARHALIVLDLERHPLAYRFLPITRRLFGWIALTVRDGSVLVAVAVQRHWPRFRLSVVVPAHASGEAARKPDQASLLKSAAV